MAIGQSGGRSAGNRQSGPRRATPRERQHVDPPGHSEWEHVRVEAEEWDGYRLTPRGENWLAVISLGCWVAFCVLLSVVVCAWWGLL